MKLHAGLIVSPYKHFAGTWDPALSLSLNSGTIKESGRFFPREDWRSPTDAEITLLTEDDSGLNPSKQIQLFTIPERLHREIWNLDLQELTDQGSAAESLTSSYDRFIKQVAEFLSFIDTPLSEHCRFRTIVTAQGLPSTAYDPELKRYDGLRLHSPTDLLSPAYASAINVGDVARSLVWINIAPIDMKLMLRQDVAQYYTNHPQNSHVIVEEFLTTYPDYPVARLHLKPCEGYILSVNHVVHDGYTRDMTEPDFNLLVEPGLVTTSSKQAKGM